MGALEVFDIEPKNLLATFKYMEKAYDIEFDLKLDSVKPRGYLSVLQMTTGDKREGQYGDRNPGIFVKGNKLHIASAINGDWNHNFDVPKPLKAGNWYKIRIVQDLSMWKDKKEKVHEEATFTVKIDNEEVYSIVNKQPRTFENVKLYAAAPFRYKAASGKIKDLILTSSRQPIKNDEIIVGK